LVDSSLRNSHSYLLYIFLVLVSFATSIALSKSIDSTLFYGIAIAIIFLWSIQAQLQYVWLFCFLMWIFFPQEYLTTNPYVGLLNPSTVLLTVLAVKYSRKPKSSRLIIFLGFTLVLIIGIGYSVSSLTSIAWSVQAILLFWVLAVGLQPISQVAFYKIFEVMKVAIIFISLIAVLEYLARRPLLYTGQFLPVYTEAYKWVYYSAYRVETSLGHPLNNGLFFSTFSILLFIALLRLPKKKLSLLAFAVSGLATFLSGSRTAVLTLLIAITLVILFLWSKIGNLEKLLFVILTPSIVFVAYLQPWTQSLLSRAESAEGIASQTYRFDLLSWADLLTRSYLVRGSGPGTSSIVWNTFGNTAPLENGIFQLWISLGLITTILLLLGLLVVLFKSTPIFSWAVFLPILSYFPSTNFVESSSSFLPFIGIVATFSVFLSGNAPQAFTNKLIEQSHG